MSELSCSFLSIGSDAQMGLRLHGQDWLLYLLAALFLVRFIYMGSS
jgi:hypothetical protein